MLHYGKADLHIHTTYSDGAATVPEVLARAAAVGLDVVAITDHDTVRGAWEARRVAHQFGIEVIVGEEVSTRDGHLLAVFIEQELPPHRAVTETIAAVHAQGGLCFAAHPYDWASASLGHAGTRGALPVHDHPWYAWPVDGLEVFNASLAWPRAGCNRAAQHVAQTLGMATIGGSDSHSLATIGSGYTRFPGSTADDLRQAIVNKTVRWGGTCWSMAQYMEVWRLSVRQRRVRGALAWALADVPHVLGRRKQRVRSPAARAQPVPDR